MFPLINHPIKTISLLCCFLILIGLISCGGTEPQNQNPIPVDPTMPTDTAEPTDSDTAETKTSSPEETPDGKDTEMDKNRTSSPETTPEGEKKGPDKSAGDIQDIRKLDLKNLILSDNLEWEPKEIRDYSPVLQREEMIIDIDALLIDLFGVKPEPQQMPGSIEYTHGYKAVVLREDYGKKEISYSIRKPADPEEKIGMEKDQSLSQAQEMASTILGSSGEEKMKLEYDEEVTYRKEDHSHHFRFLHVYENGLLIEDWMEGISVSVKEEGIDDFKASWYRYSPLEESRDLISVTDALKSVDAYIPKLKSEAEGIPIELKEIDLVYSNMTEWQKDTSERVYDKSALHWKVSTVKRVKEGEDSFILTDTFYVNAVTGTIYFTSNSI